jgi:leucine dehydrogenase
MEPERILRITEPEYGLWAVVVVDSTALGPAAGGTRTANYGTMRAAEQDCIRLARAMTIKCSLAGLEAGGAKAVVVPQPGWDREVAFKRFGEIVEGMKGEYRTAGDLGTTPADLAAMSESSQYVHTHEHALAESVARGWLRCMQALCDFADKPFSEQRVLIQGCGAIGGAIARRAVSEGLEIALADIDEERAEKLAGELRGEHVPSLDCLLRATDILAPCAIGEVIDKSVAEQIDTWGICGAANNLFASKDAAETVRARGIDVVPDVLASAGAVVDGIGESVMGLSDRGPLLDALGGIAAELLEESRTTGKTTGELAIARAYRRIGVA